MGVTQLRDRDLSSNANSQEDIFEAEGCTATDNNATRSKDNSTLMHELNAVRKNALPRLRQIIAMAYG